MPPNCKTDVDIFENPSDLFYLPPGIWTYSPDDGVQSAELLGFCLTCGRGRPSNNGSLYFKWIFFLLCTFPCGNIELCLINSSPFTHTRTLPPPHWRLNASENKKQFVLTWKRKEARRQAAYTGKHLTLNVVYVIPGMILYGVPWVSALLPLILFWRLC